MPRIDNVINSISLLENQNRSLAILKRKNATVNI